MTDRPLFCKVVDERVLHGDPWYKLSWQGLGTEYDTWEPLSNLRKVQYVLDEWEARSTRKRTSEEGTSSTAKKPKNSEEAQSPRPFTIWDLVAGKEPDIVSIDRRKINSDTMAAQKRGKKRKSVAQTPEPSLPVVLANPDHQAFLRKLEAVPGPRITLVNSLNDIPCPPLDFEFITELRMSKAIAKTAAGKWCEAFTTGCDCPPRGCNEKNGCGCVDELPENVRYHTYNRYGRVLRDSQFAIFECNALCNCGPTCTSRVVQHGRKVKLEIFMTESKGWGLRSPDFIKEGTFVELYLGEVISSKEAAKRAAKHGGDLTYLFDLDKFEDVEEPSSGENGGSREIFTIDGRAYGSAARFINHSCEPNLQPYAVAGARRDGYIFDLALFASTNIPPFEELTFSYADEGIMTKSSEAKSKFPCRCETRRCTGAIWSVPS